MFMSASSKIADEFFYTLGRESNDSKTHWLCFASQKFCELHFDFNEKFKEFKQQFLHLSLPLLCTFLTWIFYGLPVSA